MTSPAASEAQFAVVHDRLVADYPEVPEEDVRRYVHDEREQYADAKVHTFVPILVERAVRERLAD